MVMSAVMGSSPQLASTWWQPGEELLAATAPTGAGAIARVSAAM